MQSTNKTRIVSFLLVLVLALSLLPFQAFEGFAAPNPYIFTLSSNPATQKEQILGMQTADKNCKVTITIPAGTTKLYYQIQNRRGASVEIKGSGKGVSILRA